MKMSGGDPSTEFRRLDMGVERKMALAVGKNRKIKRLWALTSDFARTVRGFFLSHGYNDTGEEKKCD